MRQDLTKFHSVFEKNNTQIWHLMIPCCFLTILLSAGSSTGKHVISPEPPGESTGDVSQFGRIKRGEFDDWYSKYKEDQLKIEEGNLETRKKESEKPRTTYRNHHKKGWTATDTSIVLGVVLAFSLAIIKLCCCSELSRPSTTVQNQTFIFNHGDNRGIPQTGPMTAAFVTTLPHQGAPPPQYLDDDPPPDYFTATNTLLNPTVQSTDR